LSHSLPSPHPPLVSVIIPTYNCGRFIKDTLDSVFGQNYPSLEVIVVDDGSTDDTCAVIARYGTRVILIRQENSGAAVARNEGIRRARGEFVALLDGDDIWLPGKLWHQVNYLDQHPSVAMCCSRWRVLSPDASGTYTIETGPAPEVVRADPECSGWIYCELLLDCAVWTSTVLMRRQLIEQTGFFDPELRRGQDYDYWLRASRLTLIDRLDAPLALYRLQQGAQDRKFPNTNWELIVVRRAIERWGIAGPDRRTVSRSKLQTRLWRLNFSFGHAQYQQGRYLQARAAFASALRERPTHIKTFLYFLASALGQVLGLRRQGTAI
jgi:glycosyltransferase involved in cell wall biosynthesis